MCLGEAQTKLAANEYNKHSHTVSLSETLPMGFHLDHTQSKANATQQNPLQTDLSKMGNTQRRTHTHSSTTDEFNTGKKKP